MSSHAGAVRALLVLVTPALLAAEEPAAVGKLLAAADAPRRVIEEGVIRLQVTVEDPGSPGTESALDVYVQGSGRALCIFRDGSLKERRILMVGDKTWLIVPGTRRAIPITPSQRLLGGASIGDVAGLWFAETYTGTLREARESVEGHDCRAIALDARARTAPYPGATLWVGEDGFPRKAELRLASGKPAKEVLFTEYDTWQGRPVLRQMRIRHLLPSERGQVTTIRYLSFEERALDPSMFDPKGARLVP